MRCKRSQTATEYLIILAVVIVISLIVIGVLGEVPSIGGGVSNSANDAKLKTGKAAIVSYSVTNEGTRVVIRNNQADTVKVSALDINGTACSSTDLPAVLPAGISKELLCTNIKSLIREDVFEFPLIINYTDTKTNSNYVLDDDLKLIGRVGHKTVTIWAETIFSTVEINSSTTNGPALETSDNYGKSIANVGDLDGDGVNDIAIGANNDDAEGTDKGAVHIHFMNSDGSIKSSVEINDSTTNGPTLDDFDNYGSSVASLGDLDGDGVIDLVVGASGNNGFFDPELGSAPSNVGAVHIHLMNSDGSVKTTSEITTLIANGPNLAGSDYYGTSVASLGDLNLDGVNDIVVGAMWDAAGGSARGAVHIHFMNFDGSVNSTVEINSTTSNGPVLSNWDRYGSSVANLGDLDGDGVTDLAVGAYMNAVHIHFLNSNGSIKSSNVININSENTPTLGGELYGSSIANLGDLDGDGVIDIGVGASTYDGGGSARGAIRISFLNSNGGVKRSLEIGESMSGGPILINDDNYGASVINFGDLDGNGVIDLAVGAMGDDTGGDGKGAVYIHFLNSTLW